PGALSKPFAGYANFAACIAANQDQPHPTTFCAALMPKKKKTHADEPAIDTVAAAASMAEGEKTITAVGVLLQSLSDQLVQIQNLITVDAADLDEDETTKPTAAGGAVGDVS